jgi:hypothetical protein
MKRLSPLEMMLIFASVLVLATAAVFTFVPSPAQITQSVAPPTATAPVNPRPGERAAMLGVVESKERWMNCYDFFLVAIQGADRESVYAANARARGLYNEARQHEALEKKIDSARESLACGSLGDAALDDWKAFHAKYPGAGVNHETLVRLSIGPAELRRVRMRDRKICDLGFKCDPKIVEQQQKSPWGLPR